MPEGTETTLSMFRRIKAQPEEVMRRRDLLFKGSGAAASLLLGAAVGNGAIADSGSSTHRYFGRRQGNLLFDQNGCPVVSDGERSSDSPLPAEDLGDQFFVFQLFSSADNKWLIKSTQEIEPSLETSEEFPDIVLDSQLLSFHIGDDDKPDPDLKATVRITFGTDNNTHRSRDLGQNLYWAISSGLNLWNTRGIKGEPRAYRTDFRQIFGNKYVELPGGAGSLKVEIVKHKKSSWWEKAFNFASSNAGLGVVSALGFPGVTSRVLHFVDEAANKFVGDNAKVIFSSRGMPIAFSKQARDEIGGTGTRIGCLRPGIWVFARGRDLPLLSSQEMTYDATLRRLFPLKSNIADIVSGREIDPLREVTYAVLNSRIKPRRITSGF